MQYYFTFSYKDKLYLSQYAWHNQKFIPNEIWYVYVNTIFFQIDDHVATFVNEGCVPNIETIKSRTDLGHADAKVVYNKVNTLFL